MPGAVRLELGKYYHVYSRGNNREDVFAEKRNYGYFMQLYALHIEPVADTYAYCLMRNHFHALVRIKDSQDLSGLPNLAGLRPSQRFSNLLNAYAKAFNKVYSRTGALFERPFGRIEVTSEAYYGRLLVYIHQNPQKHDFVGDFREWPYSSYHTLLARKDTRLKREEVLAWFGGAENLAAVHEERIVERQVLDLAPEDY